MAASDKTLHQAIESTQRGDFVGAEAACREVLAHEPQNVQALCVLGQLSLTRDRNLMAELLARLRNIGFSPRATLDIGAYRGQWAQLCRTIFTDTKITMVEAQPSMRPALEAVCQSLGPGVDHRIALLGSEVRAAARFLRTENAGDGLHRSAAFDLPVTTLDALLTHEDESYDFIKLDVPGSECDVLRGGHQTIERADVILLELSLSNHERGVPPFADVVSFMQSIGFVVFDIAGMHRHANDLLFQADIVFTREDFAGRCSPHRH